VRFFYILNFLKVIYGFSYEFLEEHEFEIEDYHYKNHRISIQVTALPEISSVSHFAYINLCLNYHIINSSFSTSVFQLEA
jgi:uncharacterized Rmd1/YagE family protein